MQYKPEEIGKRLAQRRKQMGLTQPKLAQKMFCTVKNISVYENGHTTPPIEVLFKLCDILNCDFGYIIGDPDYSDSTKIDSEIRSQYGLGQDALATLRSITYFERKYSNLQNPPRDHLDSTNEFISSSFFPDLIEGFADLKRKYAELDKTISEFEMEYGEGAFERARQLDFERSMLSPEDEDIPEITEEQDREMKAVIPILKRISQIEREIKIARYGLQESFSLLLNQLYPKRESLVEGWI